MRTLRRDLYQDARVAPIAAAAAGYFNVDPRELFGPSREREIVRARYLAMILLQRMTELNCHDIAACFGRERSIVSTAKDAIAWLDMKAGGRMVAPLVEALQPEADKLRYGVCQVEAAVLKLRGELVQIAQADLGRAMAIARFLPKLTVPPNDPEVVLTLKGQEACASLMLGETVDD